MFNNISHDSKAVARAVLDIEVFFAECRKQNEQSADQVISAIMRILAQHDAIVAAERVDAGYGLHVVK